jgi:ABC-type Mn2+/Zn2+ transport system ATPase subunit
MRLKHVYISNYKNLKEFSVDLTGGNFMDVFVGKNGAGKSNFFEALILIFRNLYSFGDEDATIYEFDYDLTYEIDGHEMVFEWKAAELKVNGRSRKTLKGVQLPDNILVYYSGQNNTITEILSLYEKLFSKKIKGAVVNDIRKFIGIGNEYKELLLSLILIQPEGSKSKEFLTDKLKIKQISSELKLKLKRPDYAISNTAYDIIDRGDVASRYWGATGVSKDFLDSLEESISLDQSSRARAEGYQGSDDIYVHYYDIEKLRALFASEGPLYLFRMLDNLKLIGMLEQVSIGIELESGHHASISDFSDGQFQSIYIYAITELFKESNCLTLLDEPDAFLHPEWQFDFLKQVDDISEGAAKTNHVLMSSHSASTVSSCSDSMLNVLSMDFGSTVTKGNKAKTISSLSSGLIQFSEEEAKLNINHALKGSTGPVLFTEGVTDELILQTAWEKLHPGAQCPFQIQGAFDRYFLRNLFSRDELKDNYPNRVMVAIFDFDEAYDDWNGLNPMTKGVLVESDPLKGMGKQLKCPNHYAFLLPIPNNEVVKKQVLDPDGAPWGRGCDSYMPIETVFFEEALIGRWFVKKMKPGGGEIFEFNGNKVKFATEYVPSLGTESFEVFRPLFDFLNTKEAARLAAA